MADEWYVESLIKTRAHNRIKSKLKRKRMEQRENEDEETRRKSKTGKERGGRAEDWKKR